MNKKANIKVILLMILIFIISIFLIKGISTTLLTEQYIGNYTNIFYDNAGNSTFINFTIKNTDTTGEDNISNITITLDPSLIFLTGSNGSSSNASFTSDSQDLMFDTTTFNFNSSTNISLWFNVTPNSSVEADSANLFTIAVRNTSGDADTSINPLDFEIDTQNPRIRIDSANGTNVSGVAAFSYTPIDLNLEACVLWGNFSGTWNKNETDSNVITGNQDTFSINPIDGIYIWNVICNDSIGHSASNSTNYTITVDTIPPTTAPYITVTDSDGDGNINITWAADSGAMMYGVFRSLLNLTNATTATRLANVTRTEFVDNTTLQPVIWYYGVTSIDYAGNENLSVINTTTGAFINGTANDTITPAKALGLNGTVTDDGDSTTSNQINLRWSATSFDVRGNSEWYVRYVVYYKASSSAVNTSPTDGNLNTSGYSVWYNNTANSTSFSCTGCTSAATYHFFVTTLDDGGNANLTVTTGDGGNYLNTSLIYTAPTTSSSSSGGGGGGTASASEGVSASKMWSVLAVGASTMTVSKSAIAVTGITLNMKNQVSNAEVTVTKLNEKPSTLSKPSDEAYQYLKIDKTSIKDADFESVKIKFKVAKSWLTSQGVNEGDIALYKYTTKWVKLLTKKIKSESDYVTYEATTSGFSYFAITGKKAVAKTATLTGGEETTGGASGEGADSAESAKSNNEGSNIKGKSWIGWTIVSSVILIGLIAYFWWSNKRRINQRPNEEE